MNTIPNNLVPVIGGDVVELSGVYGIGPTKGGTPLKIGYAKRPSYRLDDLQVAYWEEFSMHCVGWVVDLMLARRVEVECHRLLDRAGKRIRGDWFSINAEWAWKTMKVAAANLKIPLLSTKDVIPLLRSRGEVTMLEATRIADLSFDRAIE